MATADQEKLGTPAMIEKERAITATNKLMERLTAEGTPGSEELMILIESIKELAKPSKEKAVDLFKKVEEKFPHKTLGEDKWYLVVVSVSELHFMNITDSQ
jgi:hypothetical protein